MRKEIWKELSLAGIPGIVFSRLLPSSQFWEADFQWTYIHVGGKNHHSRPPAEEGRFMTGTWPQIFTNPIQKPQVQFTFTIR